MESIYGEYEEKLEIIMNALLDMLNGYALKVKEAEGRMPFDHINHRIKSDASMREKCRKKGLDETTVNALTVVKDAIGLRIVCLFVDEVYQNIEYIRNLPHVSVISEKDYIKQSKPNGYRSYHMILEIETDFSDARGDDPGHYYAELQLRTIAMDTWAQLEHEIKYKHDISNPQLIAKELKLCADKLAGCDVSMQTLRNLTKTG